MAVQRFDPFLRFVAVWLAVTGVAVGLDRTVAGWATLSVSKHWIRPVFSFTSYMGGYAIHLLILGLIFSYPNRWRILVGYSLPLTSSTLLCSLTKILVGRARPQDRLDPFHFEPFSFDSLLHSFPSGEATSAMALAVLLGIYYPNSRRLFWALGVSAGLARVFRGRHFLSDVVCGGGLGILCVLAGMRILGETYYTPGDEGKRWPVWPWAKEKRRP